MGGNAQSRDGEDGEGMFFLLCRTWAIVVPFKGGGSKRSNATTATLAKDHDDSLYGSQFSYCSCNNCQKDDGFSECFSDLFGPDMAPNLEDASRLHKGQLAWSEENLAKEKQRPPIYNPEDYALSLRKWGKKMHSGQPGLYSPSGPNEPILEAPGKTSPSPNSKDYRNPMLPASGSEMTLRQFGTVSELLTKLRADLKLAYPSFVQEFISEPLDGVNLLLELLRSVQLSQAGGGPGAQPGTQPAPRVTPTIQRRALLDELICLQCISSCCSRYKEAVRRLASSSSGLFTLAVCIMSNVNKSRIIALQLLTQVCEPDASGHSSVSEALSTLRLRFGEPVRFRFLVGMLTSAVGQPELLAAGLRFLNIFVESSGSAQRKLYIQAELEQAGFDTSSMKNVGTEQVCEEIEKWNRSRIDVENLSHRIEDAERENDSLKDKVLLLERKIQILQEEKGILISLEQCLKERCCELQDEVTSLKSNKNEKHSHRGSSKRESSTPAEDEGISSSERSLSPENDFEMYRMKNNKILIKQNEKNEVKRDEKKNVVDDDDDDDEETTIEDVIEELRNIINDAETEAYAAEEKKAKEEKIWAQENKIQMRVHSNVSMEDDAAACDGEDEIVPCNLQPQPPRRTRSLVHLFIPAEDYDYNRKEYDETPYSSDEGSDSLLSASKCQLPRIEKDNYNRLLLNTIMDAKDRATQHQEKKCKKTAALVSRPSMKRSESFQHAIPNVQLLDMEQKTIRHNSFDGLFYVTDCARKDPCKTRSKSLDRIDDGLDSMVDIVTTAEQGAVFSKTRINIITSPRQPSRQFPDEKHKMFLPTQSLQQQQPPPPPSHHQPQRPEQRPEAHYYFPRLQDNGNTFLIKRGHTNAGLYSGQQQMQMLQQQHQQQQHHHQKQQQQHQQQQHPPKRDYTKNLPMVPMSRSQLVGKLTDLPSGLY